MDPRRAGLVIVTSLTLLAAAVTQAAGQPFELAVKKDQFFGASRGALVFGLDGIEYRTTNENDARQWSYEDVKQVQVLSPTRITIKTYEDQGWLKLGAAPLARLATPPAALTSAVPPTTSHSIFGTSVQVASARPAATRPSL